MKKMEIVLPVRTELMLWVLDLVVEFQDDGPRAYPRVREDTLELRYKD
jgi:hypothetical protein